MLVEVAAPDAAVVPKGLIPKAVVSVALDVLATKKLPEYTKDIIVAGLTTPVVVRAFFCKTEDGLDNIVVFKAGSSFGIVALEERLDDVVEINTIVRFAVAVQKVLNQLEFETGVISHIAVSANVTEKAVQELENNSVNVGLAVTVRTVKVEVGTGLAAKQVLEEPGDHIILLTVPVVLLTVVVITVRKETLDDFAKKHTNNIVVLTSAVVVIAFALVDKVGNESLKKLGSVPVPLAVGAFEKFFKLIKDVSLITTPATLFEQLDKEGKRWNSVCARV